jgi:two-component system NtrC family sensor kinase
MVTPALLAVSRISTRLARRGDLTVRIDEALELLRSSLGAEMCALWYATADGWAPYGSAALAGGVTPLQLELALAAGDTASPPDGLHVRAVSLGDLRLGALALRSTTRLGPDDDMLLAIVANLIAPELHAAQRARELEREVEARTRQIDEQRRFTEKIIDSLPVGLHVIDREYRIHAWNRKRETGMQGVSREEAIGRTIFEILHRQPAESLRNEFDDVFRTGRVQVFHIDSLASGQVRTYRISKIPMRLTDGPVTHVITIGEDVTDWKEAQDRFAQSEKLAAIGQLAAGVMHEINNPLATIAACAESLALRVEELRERNVETPKESSEYLRIIDHEVQRCKGIIDGLLDFSRPKTAARALTDVNDVVTQTLFLVKHHSRFKKLRAVTDLAEGIDRVHANSEQLVQVFMALLMNAVDAMDDNQTGTITIRTRRGATERESVVAEVSDQGHGIPRADQSKIIEPFYTTKAPGRGTGLGLSIVYGIVLDHGGRIEVDSTPGSGSTFRILLPSAAVHTAESAA